MLINRYLVVKDEQNGIRALEGQGLQDVGHWLRRDRHVKASGEYIVICDNGVYKTRGLLRG